MSLLGDARDLAVDHGLWWPAGDPGRLRHLADAWRRRARGFESAADGVRHEARSVAGGNAGSAIDAFLAHACLLAVELRDLAARCREAARSLEERADRIEADRRHIEAIAAEMAAIVATGVLFTVFTGGLSDAAAAALTTSLVADATALGIACTEAAAATVARVAVFATLGAWDGMLSDAVGQSTRHLVAQHELRWGFDLHEVATAGAFGAGFGGALGYLTRPPGPLPPLPKVPVEVPVGPRITRDQFDSAVLAGEGLPGLSPKQAAEYLFDGWHRGTFDSRLRSIEYHVAKHGGGMTALEYTATARRFFLEHMEEAVPIRLKDGTPGLKISVKLLDEMGKAIKPGGRWTMDGRLVTFWER